MKAFENATGKNLDEDKKELASEELITTGDLGDDVLEIYDILMLS